MTDDDPRDGIPVGHAYRIPYTARPGRVFAEPHRPAGPPRCACADSRHHTPGLACGLRLTEAEVDVRPGVHRCGPCAVLASDPLPWQQADGATPLDPATRTEAAQRLYALRTAANLPIPTTLIALAAQEAPAMPDLDTHTGPPHHYPDGHPSAASTAAVHRVLDEQPLAAAVTPESLATAQASGPPAIPTPEDIAATAQDEADTPGDEPERPQADNVAPANTREAEPLPVLLDRLAQATATASAVKAVIDKLRPEVEARVIARHAEEGTDRYRRESALITVRFAGDRVVVVDEARLRGVLVEAGTVPAAWETTTVDVLAEREQELADALDSLPALLDTLGETDPLDLRGPLGAILSALTVKRELDPARALAVLEDTVGATTTKAGVVIADTGEVIDSIRVQRGAPTGVQVRADDDVKAAALADVRAFLGLPA